MKYEIGTQWKTKGGWRAVVVAQQHNTFGAWHEKTTGTSLHDDIGGICINTGGGVFNSDHDLIEPWKELLEGEFDVLVLANDKGITQIVETKDWGGSLCNGTLGNFNKENIIACVTVVWTEGDGLS